jgi:hypothetical protein
VHILPPGEGLGVSVCDRRKTALEAEVNHLFRGDLISFTLFRRHLGNVAVLAPSAGKVATRATERETLGSGHELVQRLLFYWVDGNGARRAIGQSIELTIPAFPTAAESPAPRLDMTVMGAEKALDTVISGFIEARFRHSSDSLTTSV